MGDEMKEAGILAIGVICDEDACLPFIGEHLQNLLPYFANELKI